MRIRDPINEAEEPFNLIPLTDMVFNLLIFFMAATTFAQVEREMGLNLPSATTFASLSAVPQQLVINLDEKGKPIVSHKEYTMDALLDLVRQVVAKNPDAKVIIRADRRGERDPFFRVLDVCKRAGVKQANISFVSAG
jgi:biopolymer transport protein ExbD